MAVYRVSSLDMAMDWAVSGPERIVQNVRNLLHLWRYEVPYERLKGLDPGLVDQPTPQAAPRICADVTWLIKTYEPDAKNLSVQVTGLDDPQGDLEIEVTFEV